MATTILVVEDNELNMQMAKELLDLAGFDVLGAEDAITGIELAKTYKPDLVLMDMHLPLCDGYEATRQLKSSPESSQIPVVAFTALAMEDEQRKAIQSGCSGVISKPIDVGTFAQTVATYLQVSPLPALQEPIPWPMGMGQIHLTSQDGSDEEGLLGAILEPPENTSGTVQVSFSGSEGRGYALTNDEFESFVNRVSHDLQAPLRKVRQFSGFLKESAKAELSPDNYLMLDSLDRSATQMYELLSDLLLLSRIGRLENNMAEFNLISAVNEALQSNQALIRERKARVELGDMVALEGNYQQMVQLFNQLLQNALKYCAKDKVPVIRMESRLVWAHGQPEMVEIQIRDNGLGFKKEYAQQIFEPLQRLHGKGTYAGTGVGLAIVKKIVARHQGSIQVESEPGAGSTFTIRLPGRQKSTVVGDAVS